MTFNKRKKNSRQRGSHTHGWGAMKKHRGAGSRGGRGMAGTGKKGDVKKPCIWKDTKYFGRYGFKKKYAKKVNAINLSYFEKKLDRLLADKLIVKEGDNYVIDAAKLGFNKILGYAKLTKKFKITAASFSKDAAEKIKAAGGEAIELKKVEKAVPKKEIKAKTEQTKEG
ncbi:uL15 family ribosomal protein [Candidatus Woesearchaeota archaeon]|nr:uL15 family ribosomal protein [Candidatus Woesearchaeota archaeon]